MTAPRRWSFSLRTKIIAALAVLTLLAAIFFPALQPGRTSDCGAFWKWKREQEALNGRGPQPIAGALK